MLANFIDQAVYFSGLWVVALLVVFVYLLHNKLVYFVIQPAYKQ